MLELEDEMFNDQTYVLVELIDFVFFIIFEVG